GLAPRSATSVPARLIDTLVPVALAAASWRWIEEPVLRNGIRSELTRRGRALLDGVRGFRCDPAARVTVCTALTLLAVACTARFGLLTSPGGRTLQQQIAAGARVSSTTLVSNAPAGQPRPWLVIAGRRPFRLHATVRAKPPRPIRLTGARVIAIGDSVML